MAEIVLVPTSHIARQSLENVRRVIDKEKPDCVAVELDLDRYIAIREGGASLVETLKTLGFFTFLIYWILKRLQSWLGKRLGILPGSEMVQAIEFARRGRIRVAFIDRDIRVTLLRVKNVSWREKAKLLFYLFRGLTIDYILLKIKKSEGIDLSKVPPKELINQAMLLMRKEFPQLYRVLVEERNLYMAIKLKKLSKQFKKIVAVIGAGHTDGLKELLG